MTPEEKAFCERVTVAGTHHAKYHTFETLEALLLEGIPGDFVECGVYAGGHPAIAAYLFRKHGITDRKIHLFDSFQGIPKAGPRDCPDVHHTYGTSSGRMETSGKCSVGVESVKGFMREMKVPLDHMVFHEGWFEETMEREAASIERIAYFRVDVDLYSSTAVCYRHLYGKVVPGGVVVDDDYGVVAEAFPACREAIRDTLGFLPPAVDVPGNPGTAWWRIPK